MVALTKVFFFEQFRAFEQIHYPCVSNCFAIKLSKINFHVSNTMSNFNNYFELFLFFLS